MIQLMSIEKLKELLEAHQVNQTQLARLLGRDKAVITNLLQGRRQLKAEEAVVIARHLVYRSVSCWRMRPLLRWRNRR